MMWNYMRQPQEPKIGFLILSDPFPGSVFASVHLPALTFIRLLLSGIIH